jgi:hypothetical protein
MVVGAPEPVLYMAATITGWSDRYPATVVEIIRKGTTTMVTVCEDDAKRIDKNGMSESQEYEFTFNPDGRLWHFKQTAPDTPWKQVSFNRDTKRWILSKCGNGLILGRRNKYFDFSF